MATETRIEIPEFDAVISIHRSDSNFFQGHAYLVIADNSFEEICEIQGELDPWLELEDLGCWDVRLIFEPGLEKFDFEENRFIKSQETERREIGSRSNLIFCSPEFPAAIIKALLKQGLVEIPVSTVSEVRVRFGNLTILE